MASELLLNLDEYDLNQVAISAEELDVHLPQTGDMRQIDNMAWVNDEASLCISVKNVRDDEFWVAGHIPGRPLYPGVLMIEAAAQASSVLYRLKAKNDVFVGFTRCNNVVFRGQVVPGDTLYIITREVEFRMRRFIAENQGIVNGQLVFEASVTGMIL